jgi:hypothetical protein
MLLKPPLWSSGQSSWLQTQRSGLDSQHFQIFWVAGLERGSLSLVSTIEKLLERKSSGSGLENRYYCRRRSAWHQLFTKVGTNFADKRWSFGKYSSLAHPSRWVLVCCYVEERIVNWKQAVAAYFEVPSQHLYRERKNFVMSSSLAKKNRISDEY